VKENLIDALNFNARQGDQVKYERKYENTPGLEAMSNDLTKPNVETTVIEEFLY